MIIFRKCINVLQLLKEMQVVEFAMNYEFITETMLSSISKFLRLLEMSCVQMPEALYKKVYSHNFDSYFLTSLKFSLKYFA